jgi:hypothetical protein
MTGTGQKTYAKLHSDPTLSESRIPLEGGCDASMSSQGHLYDVFPIRGRVVRLLEVYFRLDGGDGGLDLTGYREG